MIIDAFGAAFAAKAGAPRISLGTLVLAALTIEVASAFASPPAVVLVAPFAAGLAYRLRTRQIDGALVVAACVLAPPVATVLAPGAEPGLFATGAALYLWRTRGVDRFGSLGAGFLIAVALVASSVTWTTSIAGAALLTALASWIDRHRERRPATQRAPRAPCRPAAPHEAATDRPSAAPAGPSPSQPPSAPW
jgi:hypothetical protein